MPGLKCHCRPLRVILMQTTREPCKKSALSRLCLSPWWVLIRLCDTDLIMRCPCTSLLQGHQDDRSLQSMNSGAVHGAWSHGRPLQPVIAYAGALSASDLETGIYSLLCDASVMRFTLTKGVVHVQMDWALQGIADMSYDPLPPLPTAASPPGEALLSTYPFLHLVTTCFLLSIKSGALQQAFHGSEALCGLEA